MLLGSCFTEHIGEWMQASGLDVTCNPWGILFNPASIAQSLTRCQSGTYQPQLHEQNGRYYSFDHHGKYAGTDAKALSQQLQDIERQARTDLLRSRHLLVTWGTAWIYEREGQVVANCHRFPASEFSRRRLTIDEIVAQWTEVLESTEAYVTFTVSPIRHLRDGHHDNQLSKATLLMAIDALQQRFPDQVQYLPIYEFFMDDLRDYRFYAEDMVHPSPTAIQLVRELVCETLFSPSLSQYLQRVAPWVKTLAHRPSDPNDPAYLQLIAETRKKMLSAYREMGGEGGTPQQDSHHNDCQR